MRLVSLVIPSSIDMGAHLETLDDFAVKLGYSTQLAKSLIKLQVQNLSTMDADWMYSSYHYTHPILAERLAALGWKGGKVE